MPRKKPPGAVKKTPASKAAKAAAPPDDLEGGAASDAVASDAGPASSPPVGRDAPVKPSTLEKVRKYLSKETMNKKGAATFVFISVVESANTLPA
ncbi:hypothetical protein GE21DRAFT_8673 [Neurospora crassa]|uniref:Uncharacterized protein n=1 Tax=Neurospora crassa (strain ATCC 24698 / 74-OR23-1A / CBS 708.71 / DSM 1257 / FGSC 987) TaxID=367110 RepID=Q7S655_NEUCR|nr:hypothetical protein NCU04705 [Neurospora crassa OR74A]EAA31000.3 hypothetical protein NCU04705 [Neurospora crassa OR74A]KHE83278.1 hypothetical protein GE21DRAFT_8673 [Neurospora crassa]|eukprot:XP_960236.3 hypothetical protein NCU04705 [Neurospora crassa OR74A]